MDGVAGGEEFLIFLAEEFVAEFQCACFCFEDAGADGDEFIVASWMMIATMNVSDDDVGIVVEFHALVVETKGAHQFDATDFEPDEVVGVVDDAHLIGFGIANANGVVVMSEHGVD